MQATLNNIDSCEQVFKYIAGQHSPLGKRHKNHISYLECSNILKIMKEAIIQGWKQNNYGLISR